GSTPFYAGLWVGGKVAPNKLYDSWSGHQPIYGALSILKGQHGEGEPAQVLECPVCKTILAIPERGLEPKDYTLYLVVRVNGSLPSDFQKIVNDRLSDNEFKINLTRILPMKTPGYLTLELKISSDRVLKPSDIDNCWNKIRHDFPQLVLVPARPSRPGYFFRYYIDSRGNRREYDFDIYCPNPECKLCYPWIGGAPSGLVHGRRPGINRKVRFRDGNRPIEIQEPFRIQQDVEYISDRIPIPALVVDEQIYHRIPCLLISTVDKFARPPFEPRAAAIFGNVEYHHCIFGYYRRGKGLHYSNQDNNGHPSPTGKGNNRYYVTVEPFDPPDLILQDELHLIEGPLGSLVGIYETAVDFLCSESNGYKPKYIASTATIRRAEEQVQSLFVRKLKVFPPPGLTIDDRFFVRDFEIHPLEDSLPGRLYLGICAPGRGPHTPIVRIWARLLQTAWNYRNHPDIDFYWTLTGYFNAIRELAGAKALYRQDIPQRINEIAGGNRRRIADERTQELSSRISSTDLPAILDSLNKRYPEAQDALFTTSMFGTGVDIPRIGLMVVHGQPKTTSAYIQSTGRVGRSKGALVVVFFRATRPRDLNHYEFFCGYHRQLHRYVEPPTVYPFAPNVAEMALGPVLVFILRNMRNVTVRWCDENSAREMPRYRLIANEINLISSYLSQRIAHQPPARQALLGMIQHRLNSLLDRWCSVARRYSNLVYYENVVSGIPRYSVVLGDPIHQHAKLNSQLEVVYENTPQSLREVEETIAFEA
ncbi:MAG: helicase, partial [Candidatus Methanomethylicota archaeon]